jgi:SWI/SNF-related matrix-associated actin-dependent regulator of chromatin subfamily D
MQFVKPHTSSRQVQKLLRLFIYNSHEFQPKSQTEAPIDSPNSTGNLTTHALELSEGELPRWTLRIQGQVLDPETFAPAKTPQFTFSNVVRRVHVQLEPSQFPPTFATGEWNKSTSPLVCDGFEVKRNGAEDSTALISIWLESCPERFKLSPPLRQIVGRAVGETAFRGSIITALWEYIKQHKLQLESDPQTLTPNKPLAALVGDKPLSVFALWDALSVHLLPPDPVVIPYTVKVSGLTHETLQVYDLTMELPDLPAGGLGVVPVLSEKPERVAEIQKQRNEQLVLSSNLHHCTRRREFLLAFAQAPVDTLRFAVAANSTCEEDLLRRPDHFGELWVPDAIDRYLRSLQNVQKDHNTVTKEN